MNLAAKIV